MQKLRDGTDTHDPRLDRLVQFDERSRNFPVSMAPVTAQPTERTWTLKRNQQGDQGREGACVEFGTLHALQAQPKATTLKVARPIREKHLIYYEAQKRDPWPGGSYPDANPRYEGTSVLAGLQVAQELGFFTSYYWAFSLEQVILGVMTVGPGIMGLVWKRGMSTPKPGGLIEAVGPVSGGHCVALIGVDYRRKFPGGKTFDVAVIAQSWGPDHGDRGRVYLPLSQLGELLEDRGECAFTTGRTGLKELLPQGSTFVPLSDV